MALPNYSPSGVIQFGSVPWSNDYGNVRLYTSLSEQSSDIASMMTIQSNSYSYIARERRLKVSIEADRLYHCNYCMYRNNSLTDGYIYCFISNVTYINDNTSEITLETDVFQTYLYGVDWRIPACYIERATVADDSEEYLYTTEPDFPLTYVIEDMTSLQFEVSGFIIVTAAYPETNDGIVGVLNPDGYYAEVVEPMIFRGVANGCGIYWCPILSETETESLTVFGLSRIVEGLESAGSADSIVAIYAVPDFVGDSFVNPGWISDAIDGDIFWQRETHSGTPDPDTYFQCPEQGTDIGGYTPHNAKLFAYPYNFLRVTDCNGSEMDLRFELFEGTDRYIRIFYELNNACKAIVAPNRYAGAGRGHYFNLTVDCGAHGSWTNDAYTTWLAQNSGTIALTLVGSVLAGAVGGASLAGASAALRGAQIVKAGVTGAHVNAIGTRIAARETASQLTEFGGQSILSGIAGGASLDAQVANASHLPTATRGQATPDLRWMLGIQGVYALRMSVKAEIAEQIDQFFDMWGYAVDRVEEVNITSRPYWNYVKTGGAAPRSTNIAAGTSAPFTRGRGTPAEALAIIKQVFDGGVTFWHTTSGFGDYSQDNTL